MPVAFCCIRLYNSIDFQKGVNLYGLYTNTGTGTGNNKKI